MESITAVWYISMPQHMVLLFLSRKIGIILKTMQLRSVRKKNKKTKQNNNKKTKQEQSCTYLWKL